jgi:ribosomal protein S18 acetylase RimI-like enzyme
MKPCPPILINVDLMKTSEAEALSSLFRQVVTLLPYYNETAKNSEIKKYSPRLLRESTAADPESALVAKQDGQLLGFCLSRYDDGLIWLEWFGVHPAHRRKGVASALLRALEKKARKRTHKIWCDCRTENGPSIEILTAHQYQQLCTLRNHWYGQDFILWEKLVS